MPGLRRTDRPSPRPAPVTMTACPLNSIIVGNPSSIASRDPLRFANRESLGTVAAEALLYGKRSHPLPPRVDVVAL